jgi:adenosylcobinamide kinase/adenosylcobinamide-phosphate guanylyltransferase
VKSRHALQLAQHFFGRRAFIATAEPMDEEMKARIAAHQKERAQNYFTIEEPLDLANAIHKLPDDTSVAIIDCLTVWLGNLMHYCGSEEEVDTRIDEFIQALGESPCNIIIVGNEVGMGIIPENAMARQFRDMAGKLNQQTARLADSVMLMVSGIAVNIK